MWMEFGSVGFGLVWLKQKVNKAKRCIKLDVDTFGCWVLVEMLIFLASICAGVLFNRSIFLVRTNQAIVL